MTFGDKRPSACGVAGSLPPIAMMPESSSRACGRYCPRTREFVPSAATSNAPLALVPSSKNARTPPFSALS